MSRLIPPPAALAAALLLSFAAVAAPPFPPRTSDASAVAITVTPLAPAAGAWDFQVSLNTHSGSLDDDLLKSAVLVVPGGQRLAPSTWRGDAPGGHHRRGVLRFESVPQGAGPFELTIVRRGEAQPRSFQWAVK